MYVQKLSIKGLGMQPLYISYQSVSLIHYLLASVTAKPVRDWSGISTLELDAIEDSLDHIFLPEN